MSSRPFRVTWGGGDSTRYASLRAAVLAAVGALVEWRPRQARHINVNAPTGLVYTFTMYPNGSLAVVNGDQAATIFPAPRPSDQETV